MRNVRWQEQERARRSLERRLSSARLGRFKSLADFDWSRPSQCDRDVVTELTGLDFLKEATNVILVDPNGVGKSIIARNIAHWAVLQGNNVLLTSAGHMLNELEAKERQQQRTSNRKKRKTKNGAKGNDS